MATTAVASLVKSIDQHGYYTDESDLGQYSTTQQAVAEKMNTLVKGAGYTITDKSYGLGTTPGANQPLTDPDKVFTKAMRAGQAWNKAIKQGVNDPQAVFKSLSPDFSQRFGAFLQSSPQNAMWDSWTQQIQGEIGAAIGKNITLTSPLSTGLVPFNLVAP
jgi:hypothetical protein